MPVPPTPVSPEPVEEIIPSQPKLGTLSIVLRLCAVTSINQVSSIHATRVQVRLTECTVFYTRLPTSIEFRRGVDLTL
jgi:hypothetical protein